MHACKHHHPVLNERQAAQFFGLEATRRMKIEKKQWSSWEDVKPQLHMKAYDLRQQRMAQTVIQGQTVQDASGDNEVANHPDQHDQVGAFWQLSKEDRDEKIQKGKRILREHLKARTMADSGTSPFRSEPGGAQVQAHRPFNDSLILKAPHCMKQEHQRELPFGSCCGNRSVRELGRSELARHAR